MFTYTRLFLLLLAFPVALCAQVPMQIGTASQSVVFSVNGTATFVSQGDVTADGSSTQLTFTSASDVDFAQNVTLNGNASFSVATSTVDVLGNFNSVATTSLNLSDAGATIRPSGNFVHLGTLINGAGSVVLLGSAPQQLCLGSNLSASLPINVLSVFKTVPALVTLVNHPLYVGNNLTMGTGIIQSGSTTYLAKVGATGIGGGGDNSHVLGPMRVANVPTATPVTLPLGTATGPNFYRPIRFAGLQFTGASQEAEFQYEPGNVAADAGPGFCNLSPEGHWRVDPLLLFGLATGNVTLTATTADQTAITGTNATIAHSTASTGPYIGIGTALPWGTLPNFPGDAIPGDNLTTTVAGPGIGFYRLGGKTPFTVDLTVFLEGAYDVGAASPQMFTDLSTTDLDLTQTGVQTALARFTPTTTDDDVTGTEVTLPANGDTVMFAGYTVPLGAVDVIRLELWSDMNTADVFDHPYGSGLGPETQVDHTYAWLMSDGSTRDFYTGIGGVFSGMCTAPSAEYFVVVRHRNHLPIASSTSLDFGASPNQVIDLSVSANVQNTSLGGDVVDVEAGTTYALYGGNVADDIGVAPPDNVSMVDALDFFIAYITNVTGVQCQYCPEDATLDGLANADDYNLVRLNSGFLPYTLIPFN